MLRKFDLNTANDGDSAKASPFHALIVLGKNYCQKHPAFLAHNVYSGIVHMHPSRTFGAPVAYSSTWDVSGTYLAVGPGFRCMLPAIRRLGSGRQHSVDPGESLNGAPTLVCR